MAVADDDFEFALAAALRLVGEIRQEVAEHRHERRRGAVLAAHVEEVLEAIEAGIEVERQRFPQRQNEASKQAGSRSLRFYTQLGWATHVALQWLRREDEQSLDLGALCFVDELALGLLGRGIEVMPVASTEYMYSTSSWPFNWLRKQLGRNISDGERPIPIVLAYPAHEAATMLLHSLFAHELGHTVVNEEKLVDEALVPLEENHELRAWQTEAGERSGPLAAVVEGKAEELWRLWLAELLCDAVAFAAMGPSYLFAFAEMGLSVGWAEPDQEHPSMALRTKLLVGFCERTGWSALLEEHSPRIWEWLRYAGEVPSEVPSPAEATAERVCRESLEKVMELAEKSIGESRFKPEDWASAGDELVELLENDVLPVKVSAGTAGHPEILLACWLGAISSHGSDPQAISAALGETDYQRFVAKALEMSTVVRIWPEVEAPAQ